jgi:hypothetical protein
MSGLCVRAGPRSLAASDPACQSITAPSLLPRPRSEIVRATVVTAVCWLLAGVLVAECLKLARQLRPRPRAQYHVGDLERA